MIPSISVDAILQILTISMATSPQTYTRWDAVVTLTLVHVPVSLRARTSLQDESGLAHVPMNPLDEDRCADQV